MTPSTAAAPKTAIAFSSLPIQYALPSAWAAVDPHQGTPSMETDAVNSKQLATPPQQRNIPILSDKREALERLLKQATHVGVNVRARLPYHGPACAE
eukprot:scaffold160377_cov21-Tisochrysis_lutea.AAC.1